MHYCRKCIYPSTKPELWFDSTGLCSACIAFDKRDYIDWDAREKEFEKIVDEAKSLRRDYDCIVPVSGGKDSHHQVITALEYDLKVLAVTATTEQLTEIGRRNLDNISKLGVDHIEITPSRPVRNRIIKYSLEQIGDASWSEHVLIFTIPVREALLRKVPLIIWGENPQAEYGAGPEAAAMRATMADNWLAEFGGLNGLRVNDLIDAGVASEDELTQYRMPEERPKAIFLGQYTPWDGYENSIEACGYGFEISNFPVEGIGFDYENLDNKVTGLRDYVRYLKYGYGRASDIVCNHIRRNRMTREEGITHCEKWDGDFPKTYLGYHLGNILSEIGLNHHDFLGVCDFFTNKELFYFRQPGHARPASRFKIGEPKC